MTDAKKAAGNIELQELGKETENKALEIPEMVSPDPYSSSLEARDKMIGTKQYKQYKDASFRNIQEEVEIRRLSLEKLFEIENNPIIKQEVEKLLAVYSEATTTTKSKKNMISALEGYDHVVCMQEVFTDVLTNDNRKDFPQLYNIYTKVDEGSQENKLSKSEAINIATKLQAEIKRLTVKNNQDDSKRLRVINVTMEKILALPAEDGSRQKAWNHLEKLEEEIQKATKGRRFFNRDVRGVSEITKIKNEVLADIARGKALTSLEKGGFVSRH